MEIYAPPGKEPVWPATINSVQLQQDYPNTDFSPLMTADEKAEFNLFQVLPTDPPTPDPAESRLEGPVPVFIDGQWVEKWGLMPLSEEEKRAHFRAMNPPNWELFGLALLSGVQELDALLEVAPKRLYGGLLLGLQQATENKANIFLRAWSSARRAGMASAQLVSSVKQVAVGCHLPEDFVNSIDMDLSQD